MNIPQRVADIANPADITLHATSIAVAGEIFHFRINSGCPK